MKPEEVTQYMNALNQGIADLATKLQQPAEKIFELFLRQNYVKGVVGIFQIIAIIIGTVFLVKFFQWGTKKDKDCCGGNKFSDPDYFPHIMLCIGMAIVILISWIAVLFGGFEDVISRFINPDYMVIKDIVYLIQHNTN